MKVFAGLDLGSSHVRMVVAERAGTRWKLQRVLQAPVDPMGDVEAATLGAVGTIASELGAKGRVPGVRFGISGPSLIIRYTTVPKVPLWRLRFLMDVEVRDMSQTVGDALASDWNLLQLPNASAGEENVMVAVCKEGFLSARHDAAASCGEPSCGTPSSVALANAFLATGDPRDGEAALLVDIGDRNLEIALVKDGELLFARNLAGGGRALTEAVAAGFGLGTADAEALKHQAGNVSPKGRAAYASGKEEKVANALVGPVGQLTAMIQSSLAFIRAQTKIRDLEPSRILLSGGGARLRGLSDYLSAAFRCPVARFQPENALDTSALPPDDAKTFLEDPGAFAVALGLMITSGDPAAFKLDVVTSATRTRRTFRERTLWMILSGVAAAGFLGFRLWDGMAEAGRLEKDAVAEVRAADKAKRDRKTWDTEQERIRDINQRMASLAGWTEPGEGLARIQKVVQDALPEGAWVGSVTVQREARPADPKDPKSPRVLRTVAYVAGQATSQAGQPEKALQDFVLGLQKAMPGSDVSIADQKGGAARGGGVLSYTVRVDLTGGT